MKHIEILEKIKKYNTITIFRHIKPDGDAMGSVMGLKTFLNDNFKDKNVYVLGYDKYDKIIYSDNVDDEIIKNSLAIVLDTANSLRIDDNRAMEASEIIKIDHHPNLDEYGNINLVQEFSAATCEILTFVFKKYEELGYIFSQNTAKYLFTGLFTDTMSFKTTNVTKETFMAGYILKEKDININEITNYILEKNIDDFKTTNKIRELMQFDDKLAYLILDEDDLKKINIKDDIARNQISEFSNLKDIEVWCIFTQSENHLYQGTLRSKKVQLNTIANKYNGGGHKNASGVNNLTREEVERLLLELKSNIYNK